MDKAEFQGGFKRSLTPPDQGGAPPKRTPHENAYLITVEVTETVHRTYLVPGYSPEVAERELANNYMAFDVVEEVKLGSDEAMVVSVEPVNQP